MMNDQQGKSGIMPSVLSWMAHPFNTSGSALNWVLFVGLLVVGAWFWQIVLLKVNREI